MNTSLYREAATNVAKEPVSIELDGTVWADSDNRIIDSDAIEAELARLEEAAATVAAAKAAALASARAKLAALGLTEAEVKALVG